MLACHVHDSLTGVHEIANRFVGVPLPRLKYVEKVIEFTHFMQTHFYIAFAEEAGLLSITAVETQMQTAQYQSVLMPLISRGKSQ